MKASLKQYHQSPRKVRLLADLVRGKSAAEAVTILKFTDKRAADPVRKVLESAIANAKENHSVEKEELFVKEIRVDKGIVLKRYMPRAFGRATPINRRTSRISITLGRREEASQLKQ